MKELKELVKGYEEFLKNGYPEHQKAYESLASKGQAPKIMFIGCSDSRVNPDLIFNAGPGEMFTVRNVANLVPPYEEQGEYHGTSAALEFAVTELKVEHIVIMGHAQCGGIQACIHGAKHGPVGSAFIDSWVSIAKSAAERVLARLGADGDVEKIQRETEFEAIKQSIDNLLTFPFVREAIDSGQLKIHGAHFDIATAHIYALDSETDQFLAI